MSGIKSVREPSRNVTLVSETDTGVEDLRYGFGNFRPSWLQILNQPKVVLMILCYIAFIQGFVVNGAINASLSTIEKQYGFSSQMSCWLSASYEITAAPVALIVCFSSAVNYKLRWLGFGVILFTVGSFTMTIPHVFGQTYNWDNKIFLQCSSRFPNASVVVSQEMQAESGYLGVFLLGQVLQVSFDSLDPRWIGAWWIPFYISAMLSLFIGPLLLGYKRELPVTKSIRMERESQVHEDCTDAVQLYGSDISLNHLPSFLWRLFKNPVFMFVTMALTSEGIAVAGLMVYVPKFIENQFEVTAANASLIPGIIVIPAAASGHICSGYVCKKLRLRAPAQCRLALVSLTLGLFTYGIFWARCGDISFAGITQKYGSECTPDQLRSHAMGISAFILRLGTFQGPLLFGFAIDKACKVWKTTRSETTSSCWIYEKNTLAQNFFLITLVGRSFSILFLFFADIMYKAPKSLKPKPERGLPLEQRFSNEAFTPLGDLE
ncbi:solute carrier organic anion transporter family member 4A1-like isoform X1 [Argonauta hians]